eukprot:TRINITY_DN72068_c0_g1_i1.p1 TRINITY_DN72068_c0_g1~~TRINITY_DN72068_c0_g1_i1.p1  ORF type:complete len:219 (+),score=35.29 TRINITY_DN72068_c0_g1_i1:133-789(+)
MFGSWPWLCSAPERALGGCAFENQATSDQVNTSECLPLVVSENQVPRVAAQTSVGAPRLVVPHIFTRFQFSVIYTQLGATQGTLMDQQHSMLQSILKHFTKEVSAGVVLSVVDGYGRATDFLCRLDRTMSRLRMRRVDDPKEERELVFREIERICSPEEVRNLRTTNELFIDECCTTVVIAGQRFVTFRLDSVLSREYLMVCFQILRMSQEQPRMWYP